MQKYYKIKDLRSDAFRRLTGVSKFVFQAMLSIVQASGYKRMEEEGRELLIRVVYMLIKMARR